MNENIKKIALITGFFLAVIILGWAIYYFFFKPSAPATKETGKIPQQEVGLPGSGARVPGQGVQEGVSGLPIQPETAQEPAKVANGGLTEVNAVAKENVTEPFLSAAGLNYYNSADSKFYRVLPDGTASALTDKKFHDVSNISWANDGNKAVLEYPDGSNIVYDFSKQKQYSLPKEMQDFTFSQDNNKLVAEVIGPVEESNWLVTANTDGSNIRFVERLGTQAANVDPNWSPDGQIVALFRKNSGIDSQEVILIGQNQENFQGITVQGRGFEGIWASGGQKLLYDVYTTDNGFLPTLWITDARGDGAGFNNINLGVNTWINKCTLDAGNNNVYCAVPRDLPAGSGVYKGLAKDVIDDFYKINLQTGQRSLLAVPNGNGYNAEKVFLSEDGKKLFFQDSLTNGVYNINLP